MAYEIQIVVDCTDPHTLADWWAETLGWDVEPQDEAFIQKMVDEGHAAEADTKRHKGALVWRVGGAILHPDGRRILFQAVPETKSVKNRMHLDIRVGEELRDAEREKLIARGATFLSDGRQGPYTWATMADPEGNEFCLT